MTFALDPASDPLPEGLSLGSDGTISGTAAEAGDFAYRVTVANPTGSASFDCRLSVLPASEGGESGTDRDRLDSDRAPDDASSGTGEGSELSVTGGGSQAGVFVLSALLMAAGAGAWALGSARFRARRRAA